MNIIAPSILSADYMNFERDLTMTKEMGAKWLHVDIMDGIFVPNITFGPGVVKGMRKVSDLVLDVHLMIDRPLRYVKHFCEAGADYLTIHVEADTPENTMEAIRQIRAFGVKPVDGIATLPGVVSRKKQVIPALMSTLQAMQEEDGE